ncbi:MAG: peptidoglycan editing factor PgeF [Balneolales bacterium]
MNNSIKAIKPDIWRNDSRITAGFSTKSSSDKGSTLGFSLGLLGTEDDTVIESNRQDWLAFLGLEDQPLALGKQVHGNEVRTVDDSTFQDNTDGLVTTQKNLALGILVADCAAVLLADRENGVIAAVHAGWRGAVQGILQNAVAKMVLSGADVDCIEAFISPCISLKEFEVGEEVARMFSQEFVDYTSYTKPHIDLKNFVIYELQKAGLQEGNIENNPLCTVKEADTLHSYRRDKVQSGRMMAVISMG